MSTTADITQLLPVSEVIEPADQAELAAVVRDAHAAGRAVYPIGGGTSLDFGLKAAREGIGLSLAGLDQVIDYPAADMTITVEAGITIATLAATLAEHRQRLPIDVPRRDEATLGGVVATNWNGPRRYGLGTVRDYVIGIHAVDGRGMPFKGGGRVVKNVAGYDFCKLLTGSLGTLGVITQLTMRLRPMPASHALVAVPLADADQAENLLAGLVHSQATPVAIELVSGPPWRELPQLSSSIYAGRQPWAVLIVGLEGSAVEIDWMVEQLLAEWRTAGAAAPIQLRDSAADPLWLALAEFPAGCDSPLVLKANMAASGVAHFVEKLREVDPQVSLLAHAGSGVVLAASSELPQAGLARTLTGQLLPAATRAHGNVTILSNPGGVEMTHQSTWGGIGVPFGLMSEVKRQFDPGDILNPGRFVYV